MRPEVVLKLDLTFGTTAEKIEARKNEWIKIYNKIASENLAKEDICAVLIDRVKLAAKYCIERLVEGKEENDGENALLDGDFPLGNAYDADFATPYFTLEQLAEIQCGATYSIKTGYYVEPAYDVLVRKGFIYELLHDWAEAEHCYGGVPLGASVSARERDCRLKKEEEGKKEYEIARKYIENGEYKEVYIHLSRAVDLKYPPAMVELARCDIYGCYGFKTCLSEGLELLRSAVYLNSIDACLELIKLHDGDCIEVTGREAERVCETAVRLGSAEAEERLKKGFDLRTTDEILMERAEDGDLDAAWLLGGYLEKKQDYEGAAEWYAVALDGGHIKALLRAAEICMDKESVSYNREQAEHYLRCAADQGNVTAIKGLGRLALDDGDDNFWVAAQKFADEGFVADEAQRARHKKQFAWYQLACEANDTEAFNVISLAYYYGYPVEKNDALAYESAQRAVKKGSATAMYRLAFFTENGCGTEKNITEAIKFYEKASEEGILDAMLRLYEIYKDGADGVLPDKEKANRYLFMSGVGRF